jgi:hypothetical protein
MQWDHSYEMKRQVSFPSMFHKSSLQTQSGAHISKPKCVTQYNLKDQMVQQYLMESKWAKKWYMKCFKRLINVAVHNAFVVYNSRNKMYYLTYHMGLIKAFILTHKPQAASPAGPGAPSINPPPDDLLWRRFTENNPLTGKKAKPKDGVLFVLYSPPPKKREGVGMQSRLLRRAPLQIISHPYQPLNLL